jgi:hypothetical protein
MNAKARPRARVLTLLLLTTPALLSLSGCGATSDSSAAPDDPTTQSVSKYESQISKSKAAAPKKAVRKAH